MNARKAVASIATVASAMGIAGAAAQTPGTPPAVVAPAEPDPAAVERLIAAIDAAVAALPVTATAQDIEATVTYTVDQQQQPLNVAQAALRFIAARKGLPGKQRVALAAVLARLQRGLSGTGGIEAGNAAVLASGPTVAGGGNGANYTPQN